ncbi:hypothetical protein cand_025480 [Cryptosporidium andersoni]|uniref:GYF domain-containing protein n=1 Tax=Cryptosporidium andersoni TaxID=117008 RepID=A0A1J4MDN7_9CRYT|nr:hypothetical protein cand_025480 [Cryptosporidium andersoni]
MQQNTARKKKNPTPIVNAEKNNKISQYCFIDDSGKEQGPFNLTQIIGWINQGFFDGKGDILFRDIISSPADRISLQQMLPRLLSETESYVENKVSVKKISNSNIVKEKVVEVDEILVADGKINILEQESDQHRDLWLIIKPTQKATEIHRQLETTRSNLSVLITGSTKNLNIDINTYQSKEYNDEDVQLKKSRLCQFAEQFYGNELYDSNHNIVVPTLRIPIHSSLLSMSSPILKESMRSIFEEYYKLREKVTRSDSTEEEKEKSLQNPTITLESDCPAAIQAAIRYMYGYKTEILSLSRLLLVSIWKESRRFEWKNLEEELLTHLFSNKLDILDLIEIAAAAAALSIPKLVDEIVPIIADCASYVLQGPYLALNIQAYIRFISDDNVMLDELQLFCATQQYVRQREMRIGMWSEQVNRKESSSEIEIYKDIRFDQMSPEELEKIRTSELDSLLLDACLKKLLGNEGKGRLRPWLPNNEYSVGFRNGLYPISLTRRKTSEADVNGAYLERWAWTTGDPRSVSEMTFAFQIMKTKRGRLRIGVCCTGRPIITEIQSITMSKVFYYDFYIHKFVSAFLGSSIYQCTSRIVSSSEIKRGIFYINYFTEPKDKDSINNGDILRGDLGKGSKKAENTRGGIFEESVAKGQMYHLVVSIGYYTVLLRIESIDSGEYIENYFNHGFLVEHMEVTKKPYIQTKIFVETIDTGDSFSIPSNSSIGRRLCQI